jgi:uncharacterized repeat protein (TIGR03803 family)
LTPGPGGSFYGAAGWGGAYNDGLLFNLTTDGTLMTLVTFANTNGAQPYGTLTPGPDGNFYGTTYAGGNGDPNNGYGYGTIFKVTTNGTLTTLASFNSTNGASPWAGLTLGPDGNFYGTTYAGGNGNNGTVFRLNLPPDFIASPTSQTLSIGGSATFSCQPSGTGPFAYQWLSNGVPIAGATGSSLTVSYASWLAAPKIQYQIAVANAWGSSTSAAVSVNLLLQPNIYAISNCIGGTVALYLTSYPNSTNRLWTTTDLSLPLAQWQVLATNVADSNGLGQFIDTNAIVPPQRFYRLSQP